MNGHSFAQFLVSEGVGQNSQCDADPKKRVSSFSAFVEFVRGGRCLTRGEQLRE
jgi:hypothetical protein